MSRSLPLSVLLIVMAGAHRSSAAAADDDVVKVRKCCPNGYAWDNFASVGQSMECQPKNAYDAVAREFPVPRNMKAADVETRKIALTYEQLKCPREHSWLYQNEASLVYGFFISKTGMLMSKNGSRLDFLNLFCLEQDKSMRYNVMAFYCSPPNPNPYYMYCMMTSLPFLLSTFLVSYFIKEEHNMNGMFMMYFTATLLVAYISCIANYIYIGSINEKKLPCIILTLLQQFCFLAAFFWITAMSFDLWQKFNVYGPTHNNSNNDTKKVTKYSIYVWGCTFAITVLTVLTNHPFSNEPAESHFNIQFYDCWFSSLKSKVFWFYVPINTVLIIDLFMYVHISVMMAVKQIPIAQDLTKMGYFKDKYMMYLKLFIVMTVGLETEMLSLFIKYEESANVKWRYIIQDVGTFIQVVLIFLIFVCNESILKMLNHKLYKKKSQHINMNTTSQSFRNRSIYIKPRNNELNKSIH